MRVFSAVLATETNTFSPIPTGLAAFMQPGNYYPAGQHPDHMTLYGGQLWAAREIGAREGWTLFEGITASAQPAGRTTRAAYERLRGELLDDLRAVLPVDMVLLALHGAMVAEGEDDCEGDILARVREIVGPDVVIGAEIDPHCHLTPRMVAHADLIITYREYPHTDIHACGIELVEKCARIARGEIRPVPHLGDTGMVSLIRTTTEPGLGIVARQRALEQQPGVVSVSIAQGFPWADVPEMGSRVLVYTDGDAAQARALAEEFAAHLYDLREQLSPPMLSVTAALDAARDAQRPVVIADTSDNAGGGAASDSTWFLAEMLARNEPSSVIGPIWDPVAVQVAELAGEGSELALRVGGKIGPLSGAPVDAVWQVVRIKPDHVMTGLGGVPTPMGASVLLRCGEVEAVLVSQRAQAMHPDLFTGLGCDIAQKSVVVVKSMQHFRAGFDAVAGSVLYAAAPGASSTDLSTLPYTKARRSIWPLNR